MYRALLAFFLLLGVVVAVPAPPASAQEGPEPGTAPPAQPFALAAVAPSPVAPIEIDSGLISLSVDAVGSNSGLAVVQVDRPVGGTVRSAYLAAASTGFTGYEPQDGDITLLGQPVDFDESRTMNNGISSVNVWAEVTDLVKPTLDSLPPGISGITVGEPNGASLIDGAILAVIWNDPTATIERGVVLAYGAQQVTGDRIRLVRLPDGALSDVEVSLGVGITYGFQPSGQDSTINVNGVRLSSSAGGQDDGISSNGGLITVGGIGDSIANPTNPFARGNQAGCPLCDDELYDMTPFVTADTVTELELTTTNPSADDNFMFAALEVAGATVTWTPSGDPCADVDIITCYAPEVRFHPNEGFFPMDPDLFILDSELQFAQNGFCFDDSEIADQPTPVGIARELYTATILSFDGGPFNLAPWCRSEEDRVYGVKEFTRPFDPESASLFSTRPAELSVENGFFFKFVGGDRIRGNTPLNLPEPTVIAPIYAYILPAEDGKRVITYLMFYGFDPKAEGSIADGGTRAEILDAVDGALSHQGDWERIEVLIDADDNPEQVRFYGHGCNGPTFESTHFVPWAAMLNETGGELVDGTHPVVYSAQGSHASYPFERSPGSGVCPDASGSSAGVKGFTDETFFNDDSAVWRPWTNIDSIKDPELECWYGYGGAWGATVGGLVTWFSDNVPRINLLADATAPAGPHHNLSTADEVPAPADCNAATVLVSYSGDVFEEWDETNTAAISDGIAGNSYALTLASVEQLLATGTADGGGRLSLSYTIPVGTPPGVHRLILRDGATGQELAVRMVTVLPPDECLAVEGASNDVDGDALIDECDPYAFDGPLGDADLDGVLNEDDNCDQVANPSQENPFDRSKGIACDPWEGHNPLDVLGDPCLGLVPTIVGTDGDDNIKGTDGDDVIFGLGGDDKIDGKKGNDIICDRLGDNKINGGDGDDRIYTGDGDDDIDAKRGANVIDAGEGDNKVKGGQDTDVITTGDGDDDIDAKGGFNIINAGDGDNKVKGGNDDDIITTGDGDDDIDAKGGVNIVDAGGGNNKVK